MTGSDDLRSYHVAVRTLDGLPAQIGHLRQQTDRTYEDTLRSASDALARSETRAKETRRLVEGLFLRARIASQGIGQPDLLPRKLRARGRPLAMEGAERAVERLEHVVRAIEEHLQAAQRRHELAQRRARAAAIAIAIATPPLAIGAWVVTPLLTVIVTALGASGAGWFNYRRARPRRPRDRWGRSQPFALLRVAPPTTTRASVTTSRNSPGSQRENAYSLVRFGTSREKRKASDTDYP